MQTKLERVVAMNIALGSADRAAALCDIKLSTERRGLFQTARAFGVLVANSAEEFAIEFYTAFNAEICEGTY